MDNVESNELVEESIGTYDFDKPEVVNVYIKFKNGSDKTVEFVTPAETPLYAEPITSISMYELIAAAYSFGESPLLSLPDGDGHTFLDLNAVDYVTIKVRPHD